MSGKCWASSARYTISGSAARRSRLHTLRAVARGVQVLVQPSTARVFSDEQYVRAGAKLSEDLAPANVIVGVKQVPEPALLADKTYLFFSHTIKAQPENMALLDAVLQRRVTLIDYECISEESGKRLIAFGGNAGRAGMIAGFRGLGERLINMGISSPFVNVASAYMYADLEHAKDAVEAAGRRIRTDGLPGDLAPMTFAFTGNATGLEGRWDMMMGVDILPSELARESSQQFGDRLVGYVTALSNAASSNAIHEQKELPADYVAPASLAMVYSRLDTSISTECVPSVSAASSTSSWMHNKSRWEYCVLLEGHLFDTGLINQVLNLIEDHDGGFHLVDCDGDSTISNAIVQISMSDREALDAIITKIRSLAELTSGANATVTELPDFPKKRKVFAWCWIGPSPLVEYLSREQGNEVHVVSVLRPHVVNVAEDAAVSTSFAQKPIHCPALHSARDSLVTASYVSPEMKELDAKAKKAGIPILCEIVKAHSGKIMSFSSVCGGLPAPEAADNAIGYKFSWSPRGVLTAALNAASEDLLNSSERVNFLPAFNIEQIPNQAHSLYRGTLRYGGCCQILYQLRKLGLFDMDPSKPIPATWPDLLTQLGGRRGLRDDAHGFLQWLGAYDNSTPVVKAPSILDAFCALLQDKLSYQPGERDMAIMHHEFGVEYEDGKRENKGDTIMAKTVGLSAAIGVQLILQDAVQVWCAHPTTPDIYGPALARLEVEGVRFIEKTFPQH
ncbi:Saccharopine dehydrogenase, C-terminal [Phytophthora cactorum]|nr:Saccharopine dehydrogenase, C-terminal [Phytophthora cactorum]